MMKKFLSISFLFLLLPLFSLQGAERTRERVYLSTDREVYVAGDRVWLSAWCLDAETGQLSTFSKTAYVEVHSPTGTVQTAKIALDGGRGAGFLTLPTTLPSGNYRLLAYTKLGASEQGFDPLSGARTVSVFNTFSTERVEGGVTVVAQAPAAPAPVPSSGSLRLEASSAAPNGTTRIRLSNDGTESVSFSLSVRHDDGIPAPAGKHIADFVREIRALPAARGFDDDVVPEYEGEIIHARVIGEDGVTGQVLNKYAYISSPGTGENAYSEAIAPDGTVTFFTSNIYGDRELFLEIEGLEDGQVCHLEIQRPFLDLPAGEIPALQLYAGWARELELRGLGMQLEKNFNVDTLYAALPARRHRVFDERERTRYVLDDYTRFPVMEELFTEFIHEVRVRRTNGARTLQVWQPDRLGNYYFLPGSALVLLDGIPVLDHAKILDYDPLLVKYIDIYADTYLFGVRSFPGVVNFVTYKGSLPSMQFGSQVCVADFQGCALPLAYTCAGVGSDYPDYRQTLYWHPLLTLSPGESVELECKTPAYSGRFDIVAEGLDAQGEAVSGRATLDAR